MIDVIDAALKADPSVAPNKDGFERYFLARQADDVKRINPSDRAENSFYRNQSLSSPRGREPCQTYRPSTNQDYASKGCR